MGNKIIGIDLGSYFSSVSVMEGGQPVVMPSSEGSNSIPSVVSWDEKTGEMKVGEPAKRQAALNPKNTIFNIKRLIGRSYDEVKDLNRPYKIVNNNGRAAVEVNGKIYSPEEISAMILQKIKKTAEEFLGEEVHRAVITVPAYFNSDERAATKTASEIVGLEAVRIISEPTSAALNIIDKHGKLYVIVDSGGCTTDVSLIDIDSQVFETLSTYGDLDLGGNLIDESIVNFIADEFQSEYHTDLRKDPMALQRLTEASEKAKIELSTSIETEINLPYITVVDGIPKHLVRKINRAKFNQLIDFYTTKLIDICKETLKRGGKNISDIDDIVVVGGSTRVPYIIEKLEEFFGKKMNKSLNPDTAIATGAAKQAGILSGESSDLLLLDCTSLSFGIETLGGIYTVMIPAGTTIPCNKTEVFSTAADSQPSVSINVGTGERPMFSQNKKLGTFNLEGIMPAPRGVPQISVSFDIDANSILTVKAVDKATSKQNQIRIEGSTSLTKEEIERMKSEAEVNAEVDKKEREKIEKLNQADSLIFQTEKQIKDLGDKLNESDKTDLNSMIEKLKDSHKTQDMISIEKYSHELTEVWNKISTRIYQSPSSTDHVSTHENNTKSDDNVSDVKYEEVKD